MHRILFTTLPTNDLGLLTRSLPIAKVLSDRGYEIIYSSPAKAPSVLIAKAGFDNFRPKHPLNYINLDNLSVKRWPKIFKYQAINDDLGGFIPFIFQLLRTLPVKFAPATSQVWNTDHAGAMAGMLNKNFVRSQIKAMINLIEQIDADVIMDFWNPFACIAARILNRPLITVIQADAHPANKGFIWWKEPPPDLPSVTPVINEILTKYSLPAISKLEDLNLGDLTLVMGTPETDPLPEGSEGHYIGPVLWQNKKSKLPSWLDEIDDTLPLVWVYSGNPRYAAGGTVFDSEIIIDTTIKALAGEKMNIILTTGHHVLPEKYSLLPDNIHFAKYIPGLLLAEKCHLMIHHGGYGSCQTGLFTGKPAVIIPTFSERESNARRIAALGAGECIVPEKDESGKSRMAAGELKAAVIKVLHNSAYTDNAKYYSRLLKSYGGTDKAVHLIEEFIKKI